MNAAPTVHAAEHERIATYLFCGHTEHAPGTPTIPAGVYLTTCLTAPNSERCLTCCYRGNPLKGHCIGDHTGPCWPCAASLAHQAEQDAPSDVGLLAGTPHTPAAPHQLSLWDMPAAPTRSRRMSRR